jgi:Pin2-interacting protein X1
MMQKMGWSEGKGLGKNEDGMAGHVHVKKRSDLEENLGLGASIDGTGNAGWSKTASGLNDILAQLNAEYSGKHTE